MTKKSEPVALCLTVHERLAQAYLGSVLEDVQATLGIHGVNYVAVIGRLLGEMLAVGDNNMETRMKLEGEQLEPMKKTLLLNFEVAYNEFRGKIELEQPMQPKKEVP